MKKAITILAVLALIGLGYWLIAKGDAPGQSAERAIQGTVISVNIDQVPADGPALVSVDTGEAVEVIAVPSMGINLCEARDNIASVYELEAGEQVEARGTVGADGMIIPCESAEHYLRTVAE